MTTKTSIRTTLRPDEILGKRYRVVRLLDSGKFAHVYLAQDQQTKEPVAIKILGKKAARNETSRLFFKRECVLLHNLRHPNIVRYLDQGYEAGTLFLVMEFFDGLPLTKWLAEKEVPLTAFNEVMQRVFEAVIYLHAQGKVHLDLTPNNILVREILTSKRTTYDVRIIDFGIADTIGPSRLRNRGTRLFASPEQMAEDSPRPEMDQFSLGVMLHLCYTGYFPGLDPRGYGYTQHSLSVIPYPHELAPWVSPEMSAVLQQALAYEPEKRHPNIETFSQAWQAATAMAPVDHPQAPVLPRFDPKVWGAPYFFKSKQIGIFCLGMAALFFLVMILALVHR